MKNFPIVIATLAVLIASPSLLADELWGITGDGANTPESLFTINTTDASITFKLTLGNGDDGEAIGFNPHDGLLYHMSGITDGEQYFETIDPVTLEVGQNLANGNTFGQGGLGEFTALEWYEPLGVFLASNRESDLYQVTDQGTFSNVGATEYMRGFAIVGTRVFAMSPDPVNELYEIDPDNGSTISVVSMTLDGNSDTSGNGMATDPATGIVYAIMKQGSQRVLATIDLNTGAATSVGVVGEKFAGITFVSTGFRLSVTGSCPGRVSVAWSGGTPASQQGLVFGLRSGSTTIPSGPCQGTVLGLSGQVRLVSPPGIFGNQGGSGSISGQAGPGACGGFLQLVEGGTCRTSNVAQIP